ncbi:MAG TPA: hypothetical protein VL754_19800 [Verrucomicrobiae bacterium]|jgi:hypothetical protein|nr:hypothetical protein [Verrucomicrobiae bacterium]
MKIAGYVVALLLLIPAAASAEDRTGSASSNRREPSKLHGELAHGPYTFDQYIADLKESARKDEPKPANPVTEEQAKQVASNKYRNYKPLNPFVLEW